MVDFNDGATAGLPRHDMLTLIMLERLYNVVEAFESYDKLDFRGAQGDLAVVKSRLYSLFRTLQSALDKSLSKEELSFVYKLREYNKFEDVETCFEIINNWLYEKNLTKLDSRTLIKSGNLEKKNRLAGLN